MRRASPSTRAPPQDHVGSILSMLRDREIDGFKVEVSVSPRGFAINCTDHTRGSTADITMFKNNIDFHQRMMKKLSSDRDLSDDGPMADEYPDQWAVLADKGYQGLARQVRCVHPKKGSNLTRFDKVNNDRISSDRVIVENFFGRLSMLWRVCSEKYKWGEELYDDIFQLSVALTNHHISYQPLREETDATYYRQVQHRLLSIGEEIKRKRRVAQEKYRKKKKRRMSTSLNDMGGEEDASEDSFTQLLPSTIDPHKYVSVTYQHCIAEYLDDDLIFACKISFIGNDIIFIHWYCHIPSSLILHGL